MNGKIWNWLKRAISPLRKRSAPSPLAKKIGRVFQILTLLGLSTVALWRVQLYRDVNRRFSRIRAADLPASGAELNLWRPAVPDAENGALVLTQAFVLHRTFPDGRSNEVMRTKLLDRTNDWSPTTWSLVEAYVQTNSLAFAKAQEALQLSRFRFPVDLSYGPDSQLPHLGNLKEIARIAAFQTALDVQGGSAEEWPKHVELQLKLAGTLDDEPILISHLVRNAIIRMAVTATERSLNRVVPSKDACKRLQSAFTHAGETNLLPTALVGERAMMIPAFRLSWEEIQSSGQQDEPANSVPNAPSVFGQARNLPLANRVFRARLGFLSRDDGEMHFAGGYAVAGTVGPDQLFRDGPHNCAKEVLPFVGHAPSITLKGRRA